jgi:hypothetical protein
MLEKRIATHRITAVSSEGLAGPISFSSDGASSSGLDIKAYSRMKYGDLEATGSLAEQLHESMVAQAPELTESTEPPIFAVAYKAVPPACYYLSQMCLNLLNETRTGNGLEPGRQIQVYKSRVAATDYAASSELERQAELNGMTFSLEGRDVAGLPMVVLDDVRITGSAEQQMLDVFAKAKAASITLGYVAMLDTALATVRPSLESELNSYEVKGLGDVLGIIRTGRFALNIRTLKLILSSGSDEIETFLEQVHLENPSVINDIYYGAVNTGLSFANQYPEGIQIVRSFKDATNDRE